MMITMMMIRMVFLKVRLQFTFLGQARLKCTHYDRPHVSYIKYEDDDDDDYAYHDDDHDDHKHDDQAGPSVHTHESYILSTNNIMIFLIIFLIIIMRMMMIVKSNLANKTQMNYKKIQPNVQKQVIIMCN